MIDSVFSVIWAQLGQALRAKAKAKNEAKIFLFALG